MPNVNENLLQFDEHMADFNAYDAYFSKCKHMQVLRHLQLPK